MFCKRLQVFIQFVENFSLFGSNSPTLLKSSALFSRVIKLKMQGYCKLSLQLQYAATDEAPDWHKICFYKPDKRAYYLTIG